MIDAIFLDRDGVINHDTGYISNWEDFKFIDGALKALKEFCSKGIKLIIVTNQSGIARGYYSEDDYHRLTQKMLEFMKVNNISISAVYHCPHYKNGLVEKYAIDCDCRKPKAGMITKGINNFFLNPHSCIMIGDKHSDKTAAQAAGIKNFFYIDNSSHKKFDGQSFGSLLECKDYIFTKFIKDT